MTNQSARRTVLTQLDAQRFAAQQAAREQSRAVLLAAALERAGELFQAGRWAESRRVLAINFHQG